MMKNINLHINDLPDTVILVGDLAIDSEAMGLQIKRDRLCLIQICDANGNIHMVHFPSDSYNYEASVNLKRYLVDESRQKIYHYARFDIAIAKYYLSIKEIPNIFCTKIASRFARTYTDNHGLRSVVGELIGVDLRKEQQSSNWGATCLSEAQKMYAANDVIYLHELRDKLIKMLIVSGRLKLAQEFFRCVGVVADADLLGFEEDLFRHM